MDKANVSYRVHYRLWSDDESFEKFYNMVKDIRPAEEYALFSDDDSSPRKLEELRRRFALMGDRISRLRELKVRVGINLMVTVGHREENLDYCENIPRPFTDITGFACPGIACPNDPEWFDNYLKPVFEMMAELHPDFIWIDDDMRLHGHHRSWKVGCFCPECLKNLHEATGFPADRKILQNFFDHPDRKITTERRRIMLDYNKECMNTLCRKIEKTVHAIDPDIILGQMDGWNGWNGIDYQGHNDALAGTNHQEVRWRPGGGVYRDTSEEQLTIKAGRLGRECGVLPKEAVNLQGELENFYYMILQKSRKFTSIEPQLFCAAGTTGVAYNIFGDPATEPFESYLPLVKELRKINPFLDQMVRDNGRITPKGIFDCITEKERLCDRINSKGNCWTEQETIQMEMEYTDLNKIGLPQGFSFADAPAYIMCNCIAQSLNNEEIMHVLSKGVYLDYEALQTLNELGYGEYTGFVPGKIFDRDTVETYTDHPLNEGISGTIRNIRQTFMRYTTASVVPAMPGAEILSTLNDFAGKEVAPCGSGIFVNKLGGKIAVAGYSPWRFIYNSGKMRQLKRLFDFLSSGTLPGWLSSCHRMQLFFRELPENRGSCDIFNFSLDPAGDAELQIRCTAEKFKIYRADGSCTEITAKSTDNGIATVKLPEMAAFELFHIVWQNV